MGQLNKSWTSNGPHFEAGCGSCVTSNAGPNGDAWPPGRLDQWGVTDPHTPRWKRVQDLYGFTPGAFRL